MEDAYIGTIMMFAGNFAPRGWALCDGQLLAISSNQALFSILGTTYGGDGRTTFGLPELRGRAPIHVGSGPGLTTRRLGERGGEESVILNTAQMPAHNHAATGKILAKEEGDAEDPSGNYVAGTGTVAFGTQADIAMHDGSVEVAVGNNGGSLPHDNMPPYMGVNFIICVQGLFPPRN